MPGIVIIAKSRQWKSDCWESLGDEKDKKKKLTVNLDCIVTLLVCISHSLNNSPPPCGKAFRRVAEITKHKKTPGEKLHSADNHNLRILKACGFLKLVFLPEAAWRKENNYE